MEIKETHENWKCERTDCALLFTVLIICIIILLYKFFILPHIKDYFNSIGKSFHKKHIEKVVKTTTQLNNQSYETEQHGNYQNNYIYEYEVSKPQMREQQKILKQQELQLKRESQQQTKMLKQQAKQLKKEERELAKAMKKQAKIDAKAEKKRQKMERKQEHSQDIETTKNETFVNEE